MGGALMNDKVWIAIICVLVVIFIIVVVVRMVFDIRVRVSSLEVMMRQRPTTKEVHAMMQEWHDVDDAGERNNAPNPEQLENELENTILSNEPEH